MRSHRLQLAAFVIILLILAILNVWSWDLPFFWDSMHHSLSAWWFLENDFSQIYLPAEYDAGHPPFFHLLLAFAWKIAGANLLVSHLLVLPFVLGIAWQVRLLAVRLLSRQAIIPAMAFALLDPTFLAQSTQYSADLALAFFFLLALNAGIAGKRWLLGLALALLCISGFRGFLMAVPLVISDQFFWGKGVRKYPVKSYMVAYIPAILISLSWLTYHWVVSGWLLAPEDSPWGGHRQFIGFTGMLRNIGVMIWRILDFGRIFIWLPFFLLFAWRMRMGKFIPASSVRLFMIVMTFTVLMFLFFMPFSNPPGHRYFLITYILGGMVAAEFFVMIRSVVLRYIFTLIGLVGILSGHLWVYPDHISQGWDSSLAWTRGLDAEEEMNAWIGFEGINPDDVCTEFPLNYGRKITHLNENEPAFKYSLKQEKGLSQCPYVLQSNLSNGFSDQELIILKNNWQLLKEFKEGPVYFRLYGQPSGFPIEENNSM